MKRKKLDFRKAVLAVAIGLLTAAGAYAHDITLMGGNSTVTAGTGAFGGICNAAVLHNRISNSTSTKRLSARHHIQRWHHRFIF